MTEGQVEEGRRRGRVVGRKRSGGQWDNSREGEERGREEEGRGGACCKDPDEEEAAPLILRDKIEVRIFQGELKDFGSHCVFFLSFSSSHVFISSMILLSSCFCNARNSNGNSVVSFIKDYTLLFSIVFAVSCFMLICDYCFVYLLFFSFF